MRTLPRRLRCALLLGAFCLAAAAGGRGGEAASLRRRIDLDARGLDLGEVLKQLTVRSGADFLVGTDVARPEEFPRLVLYLELRDVTAREAADWVARALGCRYRVTHGGEAVEFTSSYQWLDRVKPVAERYNLGGLMAWEEREEFLAELRELLKVYAVRAPDYSLRLRSSDRRLEAFLAPELHARLETILRTMSNPGRVPRARPLPGAAERAALAAALERPVRATYEDWPLPEVLFDLAFQAEVNLGFDHVAFRDRAVPRLTLALGEVPLERALAAVVRQAELGAVVRDAPTGLWLDAREEGAAGMRELLWEGLPVVGYAVAPLVEKMPPDKLVAQARDRIPRDVAVDASVAVVYHERSGNLIVAAPALTQRRLENWLAGLLEGEGAAPERDTETGER